MIYFDMDGVLADFKAGVEALGGDHYVPLNTEDKAADNAMWDAIRQQPHFFAGLPEITDGIQLFKALVRAGDAPEILTAVPKPVHGIQDAGSDKVAWVAQHLGPGVKTHICLRAEKVGYCHGPNDVLIDDHEKNIREWEEAGGTGYLFDIKNLNFSRLITERMEDFNDVEQD